MMVAAKQAYWELRRGLDMWRCALVSAEPSFRSVVLDNHVRHTKSAVRPVHGETRARAEAAAAWLVRAQDATPDGGVSYGYFPVSGARGWEVSYPETTGYIITSLVNFSHETNQPFLFERARHMALWEAEVQMPCGAVQGGKATTPDKQSAAAFNTGMVLDGFVSILTEESDPTIAQAARRAADFLVEDMTDDGLFRTNGAFVSKDRIKLFNVLCAWALYRYGNLTNEADYKDAAILAVEGALSFMTANGWLRENCLNDPQQPLTHTIGYSLQGILEVGVLAGRDDYVAACRRGFDPILPHIRPNGFLPGRFDAGWRPTVRWSCLTGSAQLAIIGYRLGEIVGEARYIEAADRLVDFLKAVQRTDSGNPAINGALPGSFPIFGGYMKGGYPNWATKYLLDALLLQMRHRARN